MFINMSTIVAAECVSCRKPLSTCSIYSVQTHLYHSERPLSFIWSIIGYLLAIYREVNSEEDASNLQHDQIKLLESLDILGKELECFWGSPIKSVRMKIK